jgi:hypothetical protein
MINFFRKIRYQLLGEGKTGKYLKYAIGEILLVVVGILIALSINTWNEDRKDRNLENEYLMGLKEEFEYNYEELETFIQLNESIIKATKELLENTGPDSNVSNKFVRDLLGDMMAYSVGYEPNPGTLEDLISSGNLNKITNGKLRNALSIWKANLVKSKMKESRVNRYRDETIDYIMNNGLWRDLLNNSLKIEESKLKLEINKMLQDYRLENNLSFFMITSWSLKNNEYLQLKDNINTILNLIQKELSK